MIRLPLRAMALACAGILAGCAIGSPQHPTQVHDIEDDQFSDAVTINGAQGQVVSPFGDEIDIWFIRSFVNKKDSSVEHQLYFDSMYQPPMSHYFTAADDTAQTLPLTKINSSRDCNPRPCTDEEVVGVTLDDAMLRSRVATGYKVKISARDGAYMVIDLTPGMIKVQLDAINQVLASLGAVPRSTAATPVAPPPLCPPLGVHLQTVEPDDPARHADPRLRGARVVAVDAGSVADRIGIIPGDVITKLQLSSVESCDELQAAVLAIPSYAATVAITAEDSQGFPHAHMLETSRLLAAIAADTQRYLPQLTVAKGAPKLGIDFFPMAPGEATPTGVLVVRVEARSPAEKAGILKGDRIVDIDGKEITSYRAMTEAISATKGRTVAVVVTHATGERATINVKM
jgi:hypothetical protein